MGDRDGRRFPPDHPPRRMIASGTHMPGVDPAVFETDLNTALRYERPDPRVGDYITEYYVLDSAGPEVMGAIEWIMPGSANIRLFMDERPVNVTIGNRIYAPTPHVALYGPTSRALRVEAFGGVTIGMAVSALGWAQLIDQPANRFRDRIVPLADAVPAQLASALHKRLGASDMALEVKGILDAFFVDTLGEPHPDEPAIRIMSALIVDETVEDIAIIADRVGMSVPRLRQLSLRYFGFPPKRLMRRARFLRSLLRMYAAGDAADYSLISRGYFDVSHFLRDSEEFLGTTPRRFMAQQTPYLRQILRARTAVMGEPAQALHPIDAAI
ncbi:AraC family transcriptional regulator [Sphingomonas hengshuiensis]|uniref:HTH araC/xylS-type domain-containing protein n=1 Tax=Sphingomonas hengshuiensis TaxID=1609977 RepID=A0A7U4J8P5_9SPHN|nr:helix-turn-helix domain-containing protein [Sphingomonas hengshuiensis]AJP72248.1 hypothetical protein TS85_11290 [Sphingomonas hengshuiensis]